MKERRLEMPFEPTRNREMLHDFAIGYAQDSSFDEASRLQCMESFGNTILLTGVQCILLGEFNCGVNLLEKARMFVRAAIEQNEIPVDYGRGGTEDFRLREFAQCNWFLDRQHDLEALKEAVKWREIWFEETGDNYKTNVQLTLPNYLNAEEYEILLRRFDVTKLKPATSLSHIRGEGTMAYVLARHRLGLEYSDDEVANALNTFFKRNMRATWLDRGQYTTVALWMKIAYWKPGDDPIATLLKCYEFMPEFESPKYP
jgi:hypothetical protein